MGSNFPQSHSQTLFRNCIPGESGIQTEKAPDSGAFSVIQEFMFLEYYYLDRTQITRNTSGTITTCSLVWKKFRKVRHS
jgi:hypothetical protein